jgi:hypothetical protein
VVEVVPGGPAEAARVILVGDTIISVAGVDVMSQKAPSSSLSQHHSFHVAFSAMFQIREKYSASLSAAEKGSGFFFFLSQYLFVFFSYVGTQPSDISHLILGEAGTCVTIMVKKGTCHENRLIFA